MKGPRAAALIVTGIVLGVTCCVGAVAPGTYGQGGPGPKGGTARLAADIALPRESVDEVAARPASSAGSVPAQAAGRVVPAGFAEPRDNEYWDRMSDIHTVDGDPGGRLQFDPKSGRARVCDVEADNRDVFAQVSLGSKTISLRANGKGRCDEAEIPDVGSYQRNKKTKKMKYGFLVCLAYTQKLERQDPTPPGQDIRVPPPREVVEWCNTATLAKWPDGDKSAGGCMTLGGDAKVNCLKAQANPESSCDLIDGPAYDYCMMGSIEECDVPAKAKQYCDSYGVNIISAPGAPPSGAGGGGVPGNAEIPGNRPPKANYRDRPDETLKLRGHADEVSKVTPPAELLLGWLRWFALGGCVAGFLLVGGNMALRHKRGEAGAHATGLTWVMVACIVSAGGTALGFISLLFS
ncbi:Uncharacterised protein [Actinomadura madurae]|nr:Uncharacterised protein [Actinomadura madurae]